MKDFQRRKKRNLRWIYSYPALLLILILTLGMVKAAWNVFDKERESRLHRVDAEKKLAELEDRRDALNQKIAALKTEEGIDAEIRGQFQVTKPGERMVVVVGGEKFAEEETKEAPSLISRFFDMFR